MFTRCPECRTVFHVSAAELRAAAGTVICGACGATFDALDSLSETRPAEHRAAAEAAGEEPEALAPDDGEPLRDEDAFLEELESLIGAEGEDEDWLPEESPAEDGTAEIHEEVLEETPEPLEALPAEATGVPPDDGHRYGDEELPEQAFPDPDVVFRVDDFADESAPGDDGPFVGDDESPEDDGSAWDSDTRLTPDEAGPEHAQASEHEDDGDEAAGDGAGPEDGETLPEFARENSGNGGKRRLWLPVLVALVAVLLLTGTWAHSQRGTLLRHPAGEVILAPVYSLLGVDAAPEWNPAEFRALKWEAVADPDRPSRLIVAVEFVNDADYAQPYPIIRVALQDRFGRPAGRHDFAPADYLESHSRGRRLPAGGRVQTTVDVPDPQGQAEGFRIDFCLQTQARGLVCGPELFR